MTLTTYAFKQPATRAGLTWTDDPTRMDSTDHPAWAVWDSACGSYRVVFDGTTDVFSPQRRVELGGGHAEWLHVAPDQTSLDGAIDRCSEEEALHA